MTRKRRKKSRRQRYDPDTTPEGDSKYARKRRYLKRHGLFGFQVPEPKPWKGGNA
jgi:hypothetical protein